MFVFVREHLPDRNLADSFWGGVNFVKFLWLLDIYFQCLAIPNLT